MERLTHFIAIINGKKEYRAENYQGAPGGNKKDFINALGPYEDIGLTPDELAEAAALLQAKREGRCVVLPCKPSDVTVYQLRSKKHALGVGVSTRHISAATVWANGDYALHHQGMDDCLKKDLGKTWFLSSAEAEAALGGGGDGI